MGRRKWKRDANKESFWQKIIDGHAKSGVSIRQWCREQGVNEPSFYSWRRELICREAECAEDRASANGCVVDTTAVAKSPKHSNPKQQARNDAQPTFVPIRVTEDDRKSSSGCIEIVLADKCCGEHSPRCVRVVGAVDREALAAVLDCLERRAC